MPTGFARLDEEEDGESGGDNQPDDSGFCGELKIVIMREVEDRWDASEGGLAGLVRAESDAEDRSAREHSPSGAPGGEAATRAGTDGEFERGEGGVRRGLVVGVTRRAGGGCDEKRARDETCGGKNRQRGSYGFSMRTEKCHGEESGEEGKHTRARMRSKGDCRQRGARSDRGESIESDSRGPARVKPEQQPYEDGEREADAGGELIAADEGPEYVAHDGRVGDIMEPADADEVGIAHACAMEG